MKIKLNSIIILLAIFSLKSYGQENKKIKTPATIQELKAAIEQVMEEEKIPAVGISMINQDGSVWVKTFGKSNIEKNIDANEKTMFRIGSTSKIFVSLSILKMQEEGLLSLKDTVRNLIPKIEFTNQWSKTNPILVEHLLEHTTGWDDLHLIEFAHNDTIPIKSKESLDFHPQSRVSRWIPGTRMSYCNSGFGVAAYIVEKISGKEFEDYVQENFFNPMGIKLATYFKNNNYKKYGATNYEKGEPQKYWHILHRPAGSINATPTDMLKLLQFFISEGKVDTLQIISKASLKRMETGTSSIGAKSGLEVGYGLSNYTFEHKKIIYHGHDGATVSALSDFLYNNEFKVGYSLLINSGNYWGFLRLGKLLKNFQTQNLKAVVFNEDKKYKEKTEGISGYYYLINTRRQNTYFMDIISSIKHIKLHGDTIITKGFFSGKVKNHLPVSAGLYKSAESGIIDMSITTDPLVGEVVVQGLAIFKKISVFLVFGGLGILTLWGLFLILSVIYGVIWPFRYWLRKIEKGASVKVRLWPLITSILYIVTVVLLLIGISDPFLYLGNPGFITISFIIFTIAFALTSFWAVFCVIKNRNTKMNKLVYWFSAVLSGLHLLVTIYLLWHGVIGMRLWT